MPKATVSTIAAAAGGGAATSSSRPTLRRNQACRQCRKRKLKCDASRPHCGTCVKQWQALISVPAPIGYSHPAEPQCTYDPIEGLPLAADADPLDKIRALEEQISQLKMQLESGGGSQQSAPAVNMQHSRSQSPPRAYSANADSPGGIMLPRASLNVSAQMFPNDYPEAPTPPQQQEYHPRVHIDRIDTESYSSLLYSGWNTDLPDPNTMMRLVDVFFRCDPCGSRILHRPSFIASLRLHPKHPDFPHTAILHAICASASRWASHDVITAPDGTRRDPFAEYHATKTRQYIDRTMATGADIFPVLQACILLSWYLYSDGRWVEVWIFAGFQTRAAIPLRLNYPGTFTKQGRNVPGAYLPPPQNQKELESRRRTWWMAIMFDRIVSMGGWVHGVDERDIGTEFPLRLEDFYADRQIPSNQQDMSSKDVFTLHPPLYTDSFTLFLKAMMLFGRVTDYGVRSNLHAAPTPGGSQDPFHLPGFEQLDRLVCVEFFESLPQTYKNNYGIGVAHDGGMFDTDAYMLHVAPHAAAISLHSSFISFTNPNSISTMRCINAAQSILSAYYMLSATSLDIGRLHPFVTICWYLAAVVNIHICKYYIEIGDLEHESRAWEDINVLRFAMLEYGARSPIGTRQEKLLQGVMTELVRMTSHKAPLQMGAPLFPFSHATAFATSGSAGSDVGSPAHLAPLPVSPDYSGSTAVAGSSPTATSPPMSGSISWSASGQQKALSASPRTMPIGPKIYL